MNVILSKQFVAEAAINPNRIVKFGADDNSVLQAAAVGDKSMGVCEYVGPALGERCDIIVAGVADVKAGGNVTRGDPITSDANGKGVAAAPGAGVNNRVIGFALASGVLDDIIPVLVSPCLIQG